MSAPSRLALFLPSLRGGGAERVMALLASTFAERGLAVDLVLAQAEGPYLASLGAGVEVVDLGAPRVALALPRLTAYLRLRRPRALLSTLTHANLVAVLARAASGVETRLVLREGNPIRRMAERASGLGARLLPRVAYRLYAHADVLVANAGAIAQELRQEVPTGPPIVLIPNPLDLEAVARAATAAVDPRDLPAGPGPLLVAAGRLTEQKGFPDLLAALALLRRERPARAVILGEGPARAALERQRAALGLEAAVTLPGFRAALPAFLAAADAFVLPSRWEGSPNVLAEALAVGTPVVATACLGESAALLGEGRYGRLVPVADPAALAAAITATLAAPADPERLRERARELSLERILPRYLEVLGLG
jgi:glycosyltransferase involved in cell wall biosynthesis